MPDSVNFSAFVNIIATNKFPFADYIVLRSVQLDKDLNKYWTASIKLNCLSKTEKTRRGSLGITRQIRY